MSSNVVYCHKNQDVCRMNYNTPLHRFRIVALLEGWSFLFLLFVAMPLKYIAHFPSPVKYAGWLHGVLFIAYGITLIDAWASRKWSLPKAALAMLVSFVPFGTFWFDKQIKSEENNQE
jgi:integral membrane protein